MFPSTKQAVWSGDVLALRPAGQPSRPPPKVTLVADWLSREQFSGGAAVSLRAAGVHCGAQGGRKAPRLLVRCGETVDMLQAADGLVQPLPISECPAAMNLAP